MESSKNPSADRPNIEYEKVAGKSTDDVLVYAAYVGGNSASSIGAKKAVTIRRWAELMVHEDTEYAAAMAQSLSEILKASQEILLRNHAVHRFR